MMPFHSNFLLSSLLLVVATPVRAALVEDFETIRLGEFDHPTWSAEGGTWEVIQDGTGNVLRLTESDNATLLYVAEPFSAAGSGYRAEMKIKFSWGDRELSHDSGFRFDCDPNYSDLAYDSRRFALESRGWLYTAYDQIRGTDLTFANDTWYYLKMERTDAATATANGGNLKIWASTVPFTESEPGSEIFNLSGAAVPNVDGAAAGTNLFGLCGVALGTDAVYFDNIRVTPIPEPAGLGLLLMGAATMSRRRGTRPQTIS